MSDEPNGSDPTLPSDPNDGDDDASESHVDDVSDRRLDEQESEYEAPSEAAPLADLAERVSERHGEPNTTRGAMSVNETEGDGPTADVEEGPFEEVSVGDIDEEELWASLEESDEPTAAIGADASAEAVTPDAGPSVEATEHVVAKEVYCQRCPHLDDPPDLACTHSGTEIVAVTDSDHFRVRNCPMVDE
ncbi:MAG: hypothetical protein ABEI27_12720 [Halobellus sp.]|uniref:hypothetical protein n=1 Tax=Halobellus sp. TaxID=1979212 RepID=UPI0035D4395E